jgi:hypothetical protein
VRSTSGVLACSRIVGVQASTELLFLRGPLDISVQLLAASFLYLRFELCGQRLFGLRTA